MKRRVRFFACFITFLFLFFSEKISHFPILISLGLTSLCVLHFLTFEAEELFSSQEIKKWKSFFYLSFLFFSLIFTSFYFSDDALRHIHDGYYLLSNIDVYKIPPMELDSIFNGKQPNHPDLGSIYFPVTQAQAVLGAFISKKYGFRFIYILFCLCLLCFIYSFSNKRLLSLWQEICLTPWFLIFIASHHTDLQGFLLLGVIGIFLRYLKTDVHSKVYSWKASFAYCGAGFLTGLLSGLKPEGGWYTLSLTVYVCFRHFFLFRYISKQGGKFLVKSIFWLGGVFFAIFSQFLFAYSFLFPSKDSFFSFMETGHIFMNWFFAYNPILGVRIFLHERSENLRPEIFSFYREQIIIVAVLFVCLLPGIFFIKRSQNYLSGLKAIFVKKNISEGLFLSFFYSGLLLFIGIKGTWNPWYFLWLLAPLLGVISFQTIKKKNGVKKKVGLYLSTILPLFYLPVIFFRSGSLWQMQIFYIAFASSLVIWLCLTKLRIKI